jgi:hypothetical protein
MPLSKQPQGHYRVCFVLVKKPGEQMDASLPGRDQWDAVRNEWGWAVTGHCWLHGVKRALMHGNEL